MDATSFNTQSLQQKNVGMNAAEISTLLTSLSQRMLIEVNLMDEEGSGSVRDKVEEMDLPSPQSAAERLTLELSASLALFRSRYQKELAEYRSKREEDFRKFQNEIEAEGQRSRKRFRKMFDEQRDERMQELEMLKKRLDTLETRMRKWRSTVDLGARGTLAERV